MTDKVPGNFGFEQKVSLAAEHASPDSRAAAVDLNAGRPGESFRYDISDRLWAHCAKLEQGSAGVPRVGPGVQVDSSGPSAGKPCGVSFKVFANVAWAQHVVDHRAA